MLKKITEKDKMIVFLVLLAAAGNISCLRVEERLVCVFVLFDGALMTSV